MRVTRSTGASRCDFAGHALEGVGEAGLKKLVGIALAGPLTAIAALAGPAVAGQAHPRAISFDGTCQLSGTVAFSPRVTTSPARIRNRPSLTGTCSGTLTKRGGNTVNLSNAPVRYRATELGTRESCEANPDSRGRGELIFRAGALRFRVLENRVSGTAALSFTGVRGGSATGVANVNSPNPAGILEQCEMGGLASSPVDVVIQTTPTIRG